MNTGFDLLDISANAAEIKTLEKAVFGAGSKFQAVGSEGYAENGVECDDYYYTNTNGDLKVLKTRWKVSFINGEMEEVIDSVKYVTTQGKFTLYISTIKSGCDINARLIDKIQKVLGVEN